MGEISVALANWNGHKYIERCLGALYAQTHVPREVVVVDNGSTDGSREWIAAQYPQVKLLINTCNKGFAAGYNRAISACVGEWVLILNTDVFLQVDFVERALAALGAGPVPPSHPPTRRMPCIHIGLPRGPPSMAAAAATAVL